MKTVPWIGVAVMAAVFLAVPPVCHGGSSTTWHVTVRNPTPHVASVLVGYCKEAIPGQIEWTDRGLIDIPPNGSHTFTVPGPYCPFGLSGLIRPDQRSSQAVLYHIQETSCLGHAATSDLWSACCWNSTFEVCRKSGSGDYYRDNDYGFCKK